MLTLYLIQLPLFPPFGTVHKTCLFFIFCQIMNMSSCQLILKTYLLHVLYKTQCEAQEKVDSQNGNWHTTAMTADSELLLPFF